MAKMPQQVTVVGSLNVDYIAAVARLPNPGETVSATDLVRRYGGKGANQAIAAARQGTRVHFIGCLGADEDGLAYRRRLREEGVDVRGICTASEARTGTALIAVARSAENMIVVAPGANGCLTSRWVRTRRASIAAAKALLVQFEVPFEVVKEAVTLANRAGVPVVLNPSPWKSGFPWMSCQVDTLIVNETEAQNIFGLSPDNIASRMDTWRGALKRKRVTNLLLTRGARSTFCLSPGACFEVPTLRVRPVDTVGAGDAFAGAYAAKRAQGVDFAMAVRHANCAGALATLKTGAQEATPGRAETERALRRLTPNRPVT